jgi:threonyl-tRNA synthetase
VLPIADRHLEYARGVHEQLRSADVRVEIDDRTESVGRKIRGAELRKIPYMLVVGDREAETGEVALRAHRGGDQGSVAVKEFAAQLAELVKKRA